MAKYSAELLFPPKEQSIGVLGGFACPPGLDLIRKTGIEGENSVGSQSSMKMVAGAIAGMKNVKQILGPGFGQIHGAYVSDLSDEIGGPPIRLIPAPAQVFEKLSTVDTDLTTKPVPEIISPPLGAEPPKPTGSLPSILF